VAFDKGGDIYTESVRADGTGSGLTRLTTDGHSGHARWSPNGKLLAFERRGDIYTMSATGTAVHRLTRTGGNYQPTWSRSGDQIAFVHVQSNGHGDIYRIGKSGGASVRLTHDAQTSCGDDHPSWSPISNTVVYHQTIEASCTSTTPSWTGNRILTVNTVTGHEQVLLRDYSIKGAPGATVDNPVFTPDGKHLVLFAQCGKSFCETNWLTAYLEVTLSGTLTKGTYTLSDSGGTAPELLPDQAVSPDGQWLVASVAWAQDPISNVLTTYKIGTSDNRPGLVSVASQNVIAFHPDWQPVH
jgi:Tol biopolymer transport system component